MKNSSQIIDQKSISTERLIQAISGKDFVVKKKEEKWYEIIRKLPEGIRSALLAELSLGNSLISIQDSNWPQRGSVVVCLASPFKFDFSRNNFGVKKRIMNDPHYWNQDVYQTIDGIDYLIIC